MVIFLRALGRFRTDTAVVSRAYGVVVFSHILLLMADSSCRALISTAIIGDSGMIGFIGLLAAATVATAVSASGGGGGGIEVVELSGEATVSIEVLATPSILVCRFLLLNTAVWLLT